MKTIRRVLLAALIILCLSACGQKNAAPTWQEQYDLGIRYLSEGNYEEAIIAFTAAIEIDPKNADAYRSLAEVYIAQGNTEQVRKVLEEGCAATGDAALQMQLAELLAAMVNGELRMDSFDMDGKLNSYSIFYKDPVAGCDRVDAYSLDGILQNYYLYHYSEDGLTQTSDCYSPAGELLLSSTLVMDENGQMLSSKSSDGRETKHIYDENGEYLGWDNYDNGVLSSYARYEDEGVVFYDAAGNKTGYR